jgi:hypothetical protein
VTRTHLHVREAPAIALRSVESPATSNALACRLSAGLGRRPVLAVGLPFAAGGPLGELVGVVGAQVRFDFESEGCQSGQDPLGLLIGEAHRDRFV